MNLETLVVRLIGDGSSYEKMLKDAATATGAALAKIQADMDNLVSKTVNELAYGLGTELVKSLTDMSTAAVQAFSDFDHSMRFSLAILGDLSQQQKDLMEQMAFKTASSMALEPKKVADAYFYLASAGFNAAQSLRLLPTVAKFAVAGGFDLSTAVTLSADAMAALHLKTGDIIQDEKELTKVTDILVRANTLANANVEQFSKALTTKAAAALKVVNKDITEGVAVLAAYAEQGMKGQLAGNMLSRALLLLSGSAEKNLAAHQKLGFAVYDSSGKMNHMADIVQNLEQITAGMSDEMVQSTLGVLGFEARVRQAIVPLLGSSQAIRKFEAELKKATGYTDQVASKILDSFQSQVKQLWVEIKVASIIVGKSLAPVLVTIVQSIKSVLMVWNSLSEGFKKSISVVTAVTVAITALGLVLPLITKALLIMSPVLAGLFLQLKVFGVAMISNPYTAWIVAIGALLVSLSAFESNLGAVAKTITVFISLLIAAQLSSKLFALAALAIPAAWKAISAVFFVVMGQVGSLTTLLSNLGSVITGLGVAKIAGLGVLAGLFAGLAVVVYKLVDAMGQLNKETDKSKTLDDKLAALETARIKTLTDTAKEAAKTNPVGASDMLAKETADLEKRIQTYLDLIKSGKEKIANAGKVEETGRFTKGLNDYVLGPATKLAQTVMGSIPGFKFFDQIQLENDEKKLEQVRQRLEEINKAKEELQTNLSVKVLSLELINDIQKIIDNFGKSREEIRRNELEMALFNQTIKELNEIAPGVDIDLGMVYDSVVTGLKEVDDKLTEMKLQKHGEDAKKLTEEFEDFSATLGMTARQAKVFSLQQKALRDTGVGLDADTLTKLIEGAGNADAADNMHKIIEKSKQIMEEFRTPLEKFDERMRELDEIMASDAPLSMEVYEKAVKAARDEMNKAGKAADSLKGKFDAAAYGSAEALSRISEYAATGGSAVRKGKNTFSGGRFSSSGGVKFTGRDFGPLTDVGSGIDLGNIGTVIAANVKEATDTVNSTGTGKFGFVAKAMKQIMGAGPQFGYDDKAKMEFSVSPPPKPRFDPYVDSGSSTRANNDSFKMVADKAIQILTKISDTIAKSNNKPGIDIKSAKIEE